MLKKIKSKKGFTLIEVIVVLVILAIIIALAVPSVMKYIDDANDAKDDIKISYLNKATEGYRVRLYGDGEWDGKTDLFSGINSSKEKQEKLFESKWIDEYQTSIYDDNDYFKWDVTKQRWVRSDGSDSGLTEEEKKDNETILGDLADGTDKGQWKSGKYIYGDIVFVEKDGKKTFYKCIVHGGQEVESVHGPIEGSNKGESYWKEIKLKFDQFNIYETGDIVLYNDEYYKASGFESSENFNAYMDHINEEFKHIQFPSDDDYIKAAFIKVVWNGEKFE